MIYRVLTVLLNLEEMEDDHYAHGIIKWFSKEKGYGVLKVYKDNAVGDIFVHKSNIQRDKEGNLVTLVSDAFRV